MILDVDADNLVEARRKNPADAGSRGCLRKIDQVQSFRLRVMYFCNLPMAATDAICTAPYPSTHSTNTSTEPQSP